MDRDYTNEEEFEKNIVEHASKIFGSNPSLPNDFGFVLRATYSPV